MLTFNKKYFILAFILFIIEVLIALFINDSFIRPTLGDVLVVMLIYCFLKTFLKTPYRIIAISTLVFAVLVELLQYVHIVEILGLENNAVARTVIGTSFSRKDIIAYTAGIAVVLVVERLLSKKNKDSALVR